jgi:hypothetical protein
MEHFMAIAMNRFPIVYVVYNGLLAKPPRYQIESNPTIDVITERIALHRLIPDVLSPQSAQLKILKGHRRRCDSQRAGLRVWMEDNSRAQ